MPSAPEFPFYFDIPAYTPAQKGFFQSSLAQRVKSFVLDSIGFDSCKRQMNAWLRWASPTRNVHHMVSYLNPVEHLKDLLEEGKSWAGNFASYIEGSKSYQAVKSRLVSLGVQNFLKKHQKRLFKGSVAAGVGYTFYPEIKIVASSVKRTVIKTKEAISGTIYLLNTFSQLTSRMVEIVGYPVKLTRSLESKSVGFLSLSEDGVDNSEEPSLTEAALGVGVFSFVLGGLYFDLFSKEVSGHDIQGFVNHGLIPTGKLYFLLGGVLALSTPRFLKTIVSHSVGQLASLTAFLWSSTKKYREYVSPEDKAKEEEQREIETYLQVVGGILNRVAVSSEEKGKMLVVMIMNGLMNGIKFWKLKNPEKLNQVFSGISRPPPDFS